MAVNPTNKRGQHQLHVHLSPVQRDLQNALRDVANAKKTDFVPIDCKGSPSSCTKECGKAQAQQCTALLNQKPSGSGITAKWVDVAHPFLMKPFASAPDKKCQAVLVSQPTSSGFVLVHADDRAAECLLYCTSTGGGSVTECQGHCQTDHLGC